MPIDPMRKSEPAGNDAESKRVMQCPYCRNGSIVKSEHKALLGLYTKEKYICDKCGATFTQEKNKYKLVEGIDRTSQFWQDYKERGLTIKQWRAIASGAAVHYDIKAGGYIPYVPSEYTEPIPTYEFAHYVFSYDLLPTAHKQINLDNATQPEFEDCPECNHKALFWNEQINFYECKHCRWSFSENEYKAREESKLHPNESDGLYSKVDECPDLVQQVIKENSQENHKPNYYMTDVGKYVLGMSFDDLLETHHLLKCVVEGLELRPEQLKILLDTGLLSVER